MPLRYVALAVGLQIAWSLVPSASNLVIQHLPVETYIAIRWLISGGLFMAWARWHHGPGFLPRGHLLPLAAIGITGYGVASIGTLYGLKLGGVVNFALASATGPVITAVAAIMILKERVTGRFVAAAALSLLGLMTLVVGKYQLSSLEVAGGAALIIVGAYICEAVPFTFSKRLRESVPLLPYLAVTQLSAGVFMLGTEVVRGRDPAVLEKVPVAAWGALVFVAVVACVLCYGLLYWLLRRVEGNRLGLFEGLHAVFAALFGTLFFGESLTALMAAGGVLLVASLLLASLSPAEQDG